MKPETKTKNKVRRYMENTDRDSSILYLQTIISAFMLGKQKDVESSLKFISEQVEEFEISFKGE